MSILNKKNEVDGKLKPKNMAGADWANVLQLNIVNYSKGWKSSDEWEGLLMTRAEFFNRASLCEIKLPSDVKTRREASLFLQNLKSKKS